MCVCLRTYVCVCVCVWWAFHREHREYRIQRATVPGAGTEMLGALFQGRSSCPGIYLHIHIYIFTYPHIYIHILRQCADFWECLFVPRPHSAGRNLHKSAHYPNLPYHISKRRLSVSRICIWFFFFLSDMSGLGRIHLLVKSHINKSSVYFSCVHVIFVFKDTFCLGRAHLHTMSHVNESSVHFSCVHLFCFGRYG